MINIVVIEAEKDSELLQDIVKLLLEKGEIQSKEINMVIPKGDQAVLSYPDLRIDLEQHTVFREETRISMSCCEFAVLSYLSKYPGRVFTKEQIYYAAYGDEKIVDIDNAVYCLIRNLRRKLKSSSKSHDYIQTVRGIGYKFVIPEE